MCLLSYVGLGDLKVFTSNRDISIRRPAAEKIATYPINGQEIKFPRDYKGGSWLAYDDNNIIVLLNGAAKNHISKKEYRKSRGLILLDLLAQKDTIAYWNAIDLDDIEPFTIVYLDSNNDLYELMWDYNQKKIRHLDTSANHVWLSSTLYTPAEKQIVGDKFRVAPLSSLENILSFNEVNTYQATKSAATKVHHVETVCHHQIIKEAHQTTCKEYFK